VSINIHRHIYAAVAQLVLDIFSMFSLGDKKTGIGMSEVMKPHSGQPGSPYTDQHPLSMSATQISLTSQLQSSII